MATHPHHRTSPLRTGELLPSCSLARATGEGEIQLRGDGAHPSVIFAAHSATCPGCIRYLEALARHPAAFTDWDGRLIVILPEPAEEARALPAPEHLELIRAADPERSFAAESGIEPAAVVIADAWGEIYHLEQTGEGHDFPTPEAVADWVQFIAIQCPECEGVEGPWREL